MYIYICLFLIIRKGKGWLNPLAGHWIDLEEKQFDLLQPQQCPGTLAVQKMPEKLQAGDVDSRILYLLLLQFTDCFFFIIFWYFHWRNLHQEFYDPSLCWLNWWHPTCCWWILLKAWEPGDRGAAPVTGNGNGNGNGSRVGRTQESGRILFEMSERKV